jgi:hypothetical protein
MRVDPISQRVAVLRELLAAAQPLDDVLRELSSFPYDSDEDLVTMTAADAVSVLKRFLAGELGAAEIEAWAEGIHTREDVGFAVDSEAVLTEMLLCLSSPELFEPITTTVARQWMALLEGRVTWSSE